MADAGVPALDIGAMHRTRYARFSNYQAEQCAVLVAVLNEHFDVTIRRSRRAGTRSIPSFTVLELTVGDDTVDVAGIVALRAGVRVRAGQGRDRASYIEMRHLLEDIAAEFGVLCIDRASRGARVMCPSIEVIDLGNAVLRRGDITERGYVIHRILRVLCGERRDFVLRRGNPYVGGALRGSDPGAAYEALCRATGAQGGAGSAASHGAGGAGACAERGGADGGLAGDGCHEGAGACGAA